MHTWLSPELIQERDGLIAEIGEAFGNVSRRGITWSESAVIDRYGTEAERKAARNKDREGSWGSLVDDPAWVVFPGVGGFSFLDAKGFQYYLPPAMIRCIRTGEDQGILYQLTLDGSNDEYTLEQWSALDMAQRRCVRRFLEFMVSGDEVRPPDAPEWSYVDPSRWRKCLHTHWGAVER